MPKGRESGMPDEDLWGSFFEPERVLEAMECAGAIDVVEFGCGYGHFTVAAAQRVTGTVFAIDIDPQMVAATKDRVRALNLANVVVEPRDFVSEGCGRPTGSIGYVMLFNILHIEDPVGLLAEARRTLKPGGKVGVIHWKYDPATPRGPSMSIRPQPHQVRHWAEQAGLEFVRDVELVGSPWHWGMLLRRSGDATDADPTR